MTDEEKGEVEEMKALLVRMGSPKTRLEVNPILTGDRRNEFSPREIERLTWLENGRMMEAFVHSVLRCADWYISNHPGEPDIIGSMELKEAALLLKEWIGNVIHCKDMGQWRAGDKLRYPRRARDKRLALYREWLQSRIIEERLEERSFPIDWSWTINPT